MASKIHLEIVTPEGLKYSAEVDEFTAPSVQGEFGVLPSHRPLLAGLKTGIVTFKVDGAAVSVAIGPGFAKVSEDRANIITERFIEKSAVDPVTTRKEFKDADDAIHAYNTRTSPSDAKDSEKAELIAAVRWAAVRLELYGDPPPATVVMAQEMRLFLPHDYSGEELSDSATSDETPTNSTGV